jgi:hypothetical protein
MIDEQLWKQEAAALQAKLAVVFEKASELEPGSVAFQEVASDLTAEIVGTVQEFVGKIAPVPARPFGFRGPGPNIEGTPRKRTVNSHLP